MGEQDGVNSMIGVDLHSRGRLGSLLFRRVLEWRGIMRVIVCLEVRRGTESMVSASIGVVDNT